MQTQSTRFTVFLASIGALTSISIDMSLPAVPAFEHAFGVSAGRGGLTVSLFLAGYALTPLAGGPLADRFGRRPILLTSLILFGASALACSMSPGYTMLLACRLLQGCASGVATTLPLAIVRDLLQGSLARQRISEVTTINNMMPIVAPIIGSSLMILGSWRIVFEAQAVFATAIVITLLIDFQESLPLARRQRLHPAQVLKNYGQLMTNRTFVVYSLMYALNFACMFSFVSSSPLILMQRMSVTRSAYAVIFTVIAMGTLLGSFTSGILSRRRHPLDGMVISGQILMVVASSFAAALQLARIHQPNRDCDSSLPDTLRFRPNWAGNNLGSSGTGARTCRIGIRCAALDLDDLRFGHERISRRLLLAKPRACRGCHYTDTGYDRARVAHFVRCFYPPGPIE
jgi:DHA1 family bicyclomycin/chloramphenicol resistance-like MFS transporter